MKQQTAVNWLLQELEKVNGHPTEAMILYAKKLEKEQVFKAFKQFKNNNQKIKI